MKQLVQGPEERSTGSLSCAASALLYIWLCTSECFATAVANSGRFCFSDFIRIWDGRPERAGGRCYHQPLLSLERSGEFRPERFTHIAKWQTCLSLRLKLMQMISSPTSLDHSKRAEIPSQLPVVVGFTKGTLNEHTVPGSYSFKQDLNLANGPIQLTGLLTEQGTPWDKDLASLLALNYLVLFDYGQNPSPHTPLVTHWPIH